MSVKEGRSGWGRDPAGINTQKKPSLPRVSPAWGTNGVNARDTQAACLLAEHSALWVRAPACSRRN